MEFLKSDGQYQKKYIEWWNPKVDSKKTKAMLEDVLGMEVTVAGSVLRPLDSAG